MSIANRTYKDMAFSMFANPMSGDMGKKTGASAVKGAILSILKTDFNERLFQPEFGSNIRSLLFEQMNPITVERIKTEVQEARAEYFAGLVRQAVKLGYIKLDLKGKSNKQLYRPSKKVREDEGFARTYIDTKGSMKMREIGINPPLTSQKGWQGYGDKALNRGSLASRKNETMRGWVNNQLSKDNSIYKDFMGVMNKNADLFVRSLINLTLNILKSFFCFIQI